MIDHRPKEERNPDEVVMARPEGGVKIEFRSVKFKYPTRDIWVYKDLSFTVSEYVTCLIIYASNEDYRWRKANLWPWSGPLVRMLFYVGIKLS